MICFAVGYICKVKVQLDNPVYNALLSGDAKLSRGTENVKYFDEEVSPFVGFDEGYQHGFRDLYELLPPGRKILYAIPKTIQEPVGWEIMHEIQGVQFVFDAPIDPFDIPGHPIVPLNKHNVEEMVQLARLTKPGPFDTRTIEFGNYFGIFENGKLASMTGQRLHVPGFTEISAVCTHPTHLGKGHAALLLQHQLDLINKSGQSPFLHVRADNERAIALYNRLGFRVRGPMNFYFMRRK